MRGITRYCLMLHGNLFLTILLKKKVICLSYTVFGDVELEFVVGFLEGELAWVSTLVDQFVELLSFGTVLGSTVDFDLMEQK